MRADPVVPAAGDAGGTCCTCCLIDFRALLWPESGGRRDDIGAAAALLEELGARRGVHFISIAAGAGLARFETLGVAPATDNNDDDDDDDDDDEEEEVPEAVALRSLAEEISSAKPRFRCGYGESVGEKASKAGGGGGLLADENTALNFSLAADCHPLKTAELEVAAALLLLVVAVVGVGVGIGIAAAPPTRAAEM